MLNILKQNIDITQLSNFKTKAFTKYYFEINSEKDILNLKEVLFFSKKENLKTLFI
jgi:UDP-N-acetylmuramate dehydrogenase